MNLKYQIVLNRLRLLSRKFFHSTTSVLFKKMFEVSCAYLPMTCNFAQLTGEEQLIDCNPLSYDGLDVHPTEY